MRFNNLQVVYASKFKSQTSLTRLIPIILNMDMNFL